MRARLAYRSNMDVLSPSDFANLFFTIGWSCIWSPIRTTCLADSELTIGMRVSGSRHIPHSSTMHWMTFSQTCSILLLPAAEQVQRTMRPNFLIAHCSAFFMSYDWSNQEVYLSSTLNLFLPCMFHKCRNFSCLSKTLICRIQTSVSVLTSLIASINVMFNPKKIYLLVCI